jgi:hypothetical protein
VQILKDSAYHSEEWEETDSGDDVNMTTEEAEEVKETSIHIYETWWRSTAVYIFMIFFTLYFIY